MSRHWLFALALPLALAACQRSQAPSVDKAPVPTAASASAQPTSASGCLPLRPGESLGPIRLGMARADLDKLGLPIEKKSDDGTTSFLKVGAFEVELCAGKVVEAWLDDLRQAPSCLVFGSHEIAKDLPRKDVIAKFSDCGELPPRTGGSFTQCESGGIRLGYGMGDFLQVRVTQRGIDIDDTCEMRLDDGKIVALPPEELAPLLQKTLDLDLLAPFWHSEKPGRDPLRVLQTDAVRAAPKLTMFGNQVTYVTRDQASTDKKPFFDFYRVTSSSTRVTIFFRYRVEGVVGKTLFKKRGGEWTLDEKHVGER